jgi:hypothetical protein
MGIVTLKTAVTTSCGDKTANPKLPIRGRRPFLARHFIVIIRGDALDGVVGVGGVIENVSHAL